MPHPRKRKGPAPPQVRIEEERPPAERQLRAEYLNFIMALARAAARRDHEAEQSGTGAPPA
ncbi:hypothetical protein EYC08_19955 [Tabrizicola sp. WMC-M-20]|nr:hypothetical protein EYC08_19955 [Tabrizicola sp. WMC-M-20]